MKTKKSTMPNLVLRIGSFFVDPGIHYTSIVEYLSLLSCPLWSYFFHIIIGESLFSEYIFHGPQKMNVWICQYRAIGWMKQVFPAMSCVYFSAVRICIVMLQYHIIHLEMWSRSKKYCLAFSQCGPERIRIYNCATGNITENITECMIQFSSEKNGFAQTIKIDSGHHTAFCFNLFFSVRLVSIHWLSLAHSLKTQFSCAAIILLRNMQPTLSNSRIFFIATMQCISICRRVPLWEITLE